jgi:quinol-cytochrome oxidoreductase complex cytochrome b subunit
VAVLPSVLTLLLAIHFWRIRKDGGLSRPEESELKPDLLIGDLPPAVSGPARPTQLEPRKVYGLQGLVRGPFTKVGNVPDHSVYAWPHLFMAELFALVVTVAIILVASLLFNAPLEEPVNVMHPPNPAKAPWYFLGLQEMVSYSAFWGGVGIPTVFVLLLFLVPYLDRSPGGVGKWFARERLLANTLFLLFIIVNIILIVIGTFFRGPNWEFITPW